MNQREAKRKACWLTGGAIRGLLSGGWPEELVEDDEEYEKVSRALYELADELERRGHA